MMPRGRSASMPSRIAHSHSFPFSRNSADCGNVSVANRPSFFENLIGSRQPTV
jgi:hypothetical protein